MANKGKKSDNKNLIIGICIAAVVVIAIIIAVVLVTRGNTINDSYFVSDGTKYVLTLDANDISMEDAEYNPIKAHLVYTYSGDEITGLKAYYEYADNATAKAAADYLKSNYEESDQAKIATDGKYVVYTSHEEDYKDLTASDVKQQIEFMEMLKNMGSGDTEEFEEVEETTDNE